MNHSSLAMHCSNCFRSAIWDIFYTQASRTALEVVTKCNCYCNIICYFDKSTLTMLWLNLDLSQRQPSLHHFGKAMLLLLLLYAWVQDIPSSQKTNLGRNKSIGSYRQNKSSTCMLSVVPLRMLSALTSYLTISKHTGCASKQNLE